MKKRILSLIVCIAMLCTAVCLLASCNDTTDPGEKETEGSTPETTGGADVSDPENDETDAPDDGSLSKIALSELSNFVIVFPDGVYSQMTAARRIRNAIKDKLGIELTFKNDLVSDSIPAYAEAEYEIIVGACNRDETEEFLSSIKYKDYGYTTVGKKLVIAGNTPAGTIEAVEHFISNIIEASSGDVFFEKSADSFKFDNTYVNYTIDGTPISEYTIVRPAKSKLGETETAELLSRMLATLTGYTLPVIKDSEESTGKEIHVGVTSRDTAPALAEGEVYIGKSGDHLLLAASNEAGFIDVYNALLDGLKATPDYTVNSGAFTPELATEATFLSFNVWMHTAGQEARVEAVLKTIEAIAPDIMGLQECTHEWMAILNGRFSEKYGIIGEGRDGTHTSEDQFNPILYRKDKYTLIDSGTRWLSETPEVKYTKVEDSAYERIFTFAVFEDNETGRRFVFVNTHFDHIGGQGDQASVYAAYLSRFYDLPMFMTGDYNARAMASALDDEGYLNSKDIALEATNVGGTLAKEGRGNEIDYVFTNGRGARVSYYTVHTDKMDNIQPSDHCPVYVKVNFYK